MAEEGRTYVGVDWTGESWLAVVFDATGFDHAEVFAGVGDVWAAYEETAELVLVDVPVGLLEDGATERPCDAAARAVLGPRGSDVVDPPVREAARKRRYPAAKRVTERKTADTLSKAAFAMSDGVVAVDELLREVTEARTVVAESHPEVCFRAFAGTTLEYPANTAAGYAERMRALATFDPEAAPTVQRTAASTGGHAVPVPAVLNAVALGYTARPGPGSLRSLPPDPPSDEAGLPMRILYRADEPLTAGE